MTPAEKKKKKLPKRQQLSLLQFAVISQSDWPICHVHKNTGNAARVNVSRNGHALKESSYLTSIS